MIRMSTVHSANVFMRWQQASRHGTRAALTASLALIRGRGPGAIIHHHLSTCCTLHLFCFEYVYILLCLVGRFSRVDTQKSVQSSTAVHRDIGILSCAALSTPSNQCAPCSFIGRKRPGLWASLRRVSACGYRPLCSLSLWGDSRVREYTFAAAV